MARYTLDWETKTPIKILGEAAKGQAYGKTNYCFQVGDTVHTVVFEFEMLNTLKSEFKIRPILVRLTSSGYSTEVLADWVSNHSTHPFSHAIRMNRSTDNSNIVHIAWMCGSRIFYMRGNIIDEEFIDWGAGAQDTGWDAKGNSLTVTSDLGGFPWLCYASPDENSIVIRRSSEKAGLFVNDPSGYLQLPSPSAFDFDITQLDSGAKMILLYRKKKSLTECPVYERIYNGSWQDEVDLYWETNAHALRLGRCDDRIGVLYASGPSSIRYRDGDWNGYFSSPEVLPILSTNFIYNLGLARGITGGSPLDRWVVFYQEERLPIIQVLAHYQQTHFSKLESFGGGSGFWNYEKFTGMGILGVEQIGTDHVACVTLYPVVHESHGDFYYLGALSLKKVV